MVNTYILYELLLITIIDPKLRDTDCCYYKVTNNNTVTDLFITLLNVEH